MNFNPLRFAEGLRGILDKELGVLARRIEDLEGELRTLKSGGHLRYRGVFKPGALFEKGDAVTDHGSLWICLGATDSRPPGANWQLAVKRGKDAR